jgi:hypothetical protein
MCSDQLLVKTHSPFLVKRSTSFNCSDAGIGRFVLLPVRNPLVSGCFLPVFGSTLNLTPLSIRQDNWHALTRYQERTSGGGTALSLDKFLAAWVQHHSYWRQHVDQ